MIQVRNRLEEFIQRHADDPVLWITDKTGWIPGPHQAVAMMEIKENPNVLFVWPPRAGKTTAMEAVCLQELYCHPLETELIFGPKQEQATNALKYQLDWIETNEGLKEYVAMRRGKRRLTDTYFQLQNGSGAKTFGILGHFDSEEASIVRGEEWDDMDAEIWVNRVIARGGKANRSGLPTRFRLSGTIQKGKGNMFSTENSDNYHVITKFDYYDLVQLGWYDENAIKIARREMTDDEWLRIYLLVYTEAKNYIWESSLNRCIEKALKLNWQGAEYQKGKRYNAQGPVYVGFDCGHSGEKKVHSVYRMDFIEIVGETALWLNAIEWEGTTDPTRIKMDVVEWFRFFEPVGGYGDALKANFIAEINDALFREGLARFDRTRSPENKPSDWADWDLAPQWNTGRSKYIWGEITKTQIEHGKFLLPYFDSRDDRHIAQMARKLKRCLLNVRINTDVRASYPAFEIIKKELGDDPFDSLNMAMGCANDRQAAPLNLRNVALGGREMETGQLRTSLLREIGTVGHEAGFEDF